MRPLQTLPAVIGLLAAGCAGPALSPEDAERKRLYTEAVEPCKAKYPAMRDVEVDQYGYVSASAMSWSAEVDGFRRCVNQAFMALGDVKPRSAGKVAANASNTKIAYQPVGAMLFVPVVLNGVSGTFLLDTGAGVTTIHPAFAERAGIDVPARAPRVLLTVAGGGQYSVPMVTAKSVRVGEASVEAIDIGIFSGLSPTRQGVARDGILGVDFLRHFRMTVDRQDRLLILDLPEKRRQ